MDYVTSCIVDGNWIAHRAYAVGGRQGCIEGVVRCLVELQERWQPMQIYYVRDAYNVPTHRRAVNPDYKANRSAPGADFLDALYDEQLDDALLALGVALVQPMPDGEGNYGEGDDVAFSLLEEVGGPHLLLSRDKDWLQMLTPERDGLIGILRDTTRDAALHTPSNVQQLTGLTARGWASFLALAGDTGDGIPGVAKVGKGRAQDIIAATSQDVVMRVLGGHLDDVLRELDASAPGLTRYLQAADLDMLRRCDDQVQLARVPFDHRLLAWPAVPEGCAALAGLGIPDDLVDRAGAAFDVPDEL